MNVRRYVRGTTSYSTVTGYMYMLQCYMTYYRRNSYVVVGSSYVGLSSCIIEKDTLMGHVTSTRLVHVSGTEIMHVISAELSTLPIYFYTLGMCVARDKDVARRQDTKFGTKEISKTTKPGRCEASKSRTNQANNVIRMNHKTHKTTKRKRSPTLSLEANSYHK